MDTINVGVIGAGGNTKAMHIPLLQKIKGVNIVSVCNRSITSGKKVAKEFSIPTVAEHWSEIIEDRDIDAVVIGTWPYTHCPMVCEALNASKHVLCEARMAMNASQAHDMFETSRRYPELIAQLVPSPFTLAFDATIKAMLSAGYIGDILHVDVRSVGSGYIDRKSKLSWRNETSKSGLNIMAMGIFYEALMRWVGSATKVSAMNQVFVKQRKDAEGALQSVEVPDHVDIIASMACGAQARLQFSSVLGHGSNTSEFTLYGSEGTLRLDLAQNKLFGAQKKDKGFKEIKVRKQDKGAWRVEEEFVNAIRGKEEVKLTTFEDGVRYMEFTEAVSLSSARGEAVNLPLG